MNFFRQNAQSSLSVNDANMRTTSSLESMNAVLRRMSNPHPTLFKFIDTIRMHEFSKSIELFELIKSIVPIRKSKKITALDIKLKKLTTDLEENPDMSPGSFLEEFAKDIILPNTGNAYP